MGTTSAPSDLGAHALTLREVDAPFDHMKNTLDCCDPAALRQNEVCVEVVLRVVAHSGLSQNPSFEDNENFLHRWHKAHWISRTWRSLKRRHLKDGRPIDEVAV